MTYSSDVSLPSSTGDNGGGDKSKRTPRKLSLMKIAKSRRKTSVSTSTPPEKSGNIHDKRAVSVEMTASKGGENMTEAPRLSDASIKKAVSDETESLSAPNDDASSSNKTNPEITPASSGSDTSSDGAISGGTEKKAELDQINEVSGSPRKLLETLGPSGPMLLKDGSKALRAKAGKKSKDFQRDRSFRKKNDERVIRLARQIKVMGEKLEDYSKRIQTLEAEKQGKEDELKKITSFHSFSEEQVQTLTLDELRSICAKQEQEIAALKAPPQRSFFMIFCIASLICYAVVANVDRSIFAKTNVSLHAQEMLNNLCSPVSLFEKKNLFDENMVDIELEAPWWAPEWIPPSAKSSSFRAICGDRPRTVLKWDAATGKRRKEGMFVLHDADKNNSILLKGKAKHVSINSGTGTIELTKARGKQIRLHAPWFM